VLVPQNLYYACKEGRIGPGDDVLLFTLDSMSTSGAAVLRMSDVVLAPDDD
jgi:3-oxoacyl-[acyl-carrier-protein] synthase III